MWKTSLNKIISFIFPYFDCPQKLICVSSFSLKCLLVFVSCCLDWQIQLNIFYSKLLLLQCMKMCKVTELLYTRQPSFVCGRRPLASIVSTFSLQLYEFVLAHTHRIFSCVLLLILKNKRQIIQKKYSSLFRQKDTPKYTD